MKKTIIALLVISFALCAGDVRAQKSGGSDYTTAAGIKFYPFSASIKHFIKDDVALEGLGYFWTRGLRITGLYEIHKDLNIIDGLRWYFGGGAHIGFYSSSYGGGTGVGIDGVIGLDYKFEKAPVNLSVDWQPSFEFGSNDNNGFAGNWGGIGIRYVLK